MHSIPPNFQHSRVGLIGVLLCFVITGPGWSQTVQDKRLIQKTSVKLAQTPLLTALEDLCERHGLKLEIDQQSLKDEGIDAATTLAPDLTLNDVTLGSALTLMLEPLGLQSTIQAGTLRVVTLATAQDQLTQRTYSLTSLGPAGQNPTPVIEALMDLTDAEWEEVDGVGGKAAAVGPGRIAVEQTEAGHREVAKLLQLMAKAATGRRTPPTPVEKSLDLLNKSIVRPLQFPAGELTVLETAELLRTQLKINVVIDSTALMDNGVDPATTKLTFSGVKQSAIVSLGTALKAVELAALLRHEVLLITTEVVASDTLDVRAYKLPAGAGSLEQIAERLQSDETLGEWQETDGIGGSIQMIGPALLIRQSLPVHDKLAIILMPIP